MKDYKVIQKMNNLLKKERIHGEKIHLNFNEGSIFNYAVKYFSEECPELIYPAKSYCVAIIYSHLLSFYFNEDFYYLLNDEDLLCGNDPYFAPYKNEQVLYDKIISKLKISEKGFYLNLNLSQVKATFDYFVEEFDVNPKTYLQSLLYR